MSYQARAFACGILCCLALGCGPHGVPPPVTGIAPKDIEREMARLSFLAYVGDNLTGPSVETTLAECLPKALASQADKWVLAWGPVVYRFPIAKYDDNMMYVVQHGTDSSDLAVVIRGTDPYALDDWLAEDFDVDDQVGWPEGEGQPKISKAISEGLTILQRMESAGSNLETFLQTRAAASSIGLRVHVTGHSLGGALAPTLALWLHDNQSTWDPQGKAVISVYPLAGPTPGNTAFAAYYHSALGKTTVRLWNPFDVVPRAWHYESMGKIADLYEPLTRANPLERGLIDGLRSLVKDKDYAQISPKQKSLSGAVNGNEKDWAAEAAWQHHCGYQCALGIHIDAGVQKECPSKRLPCDCSGVQIPAGR
jgi:hypothetical protein